MIKIFQNPAKEYLTLAYDISNIGDDVQIQVTDSDGKLKLNKPLSQKANQEIINIANWSSGTFIFTLFENGKAISVQKLVITN